MRAANRPTTSHMQWLPRKLFSFSWEGPFYWPAAQASSLVRSQCPGQRPAVQPCERYVPPRFSLLRCRRLGQLQCALCGAGDGGGGGFAVAGNLHRREREFDTIGVERLFDHGKGLPSDDEILTRQGHHFIRS